MISQTCQPDETMTCNFDLNISMFFAQQLFVVVASDGLWDIMSLKNVVSSLGNDCLSAIQGKNLTRLSSIVVGATQDS